jgi:hypothetical protein
MTPCCARLPLIRKSLRVFDTAEAALGFLASLDSNRESVLAADCLRGPDGVRGGRYLTIQRGQQG